VSIILNWYDRKGFYRLDPNVLAHVNAVVQDYTSQQATPIPTVSRTTQAASDAAF
jgi:hypothetical protein